jgi:acetyl-CoA C-acetyltransferase
VHVAGHPELWRSPALAAASSAALAGAGIGIDDGAHFDLYSCFASSVCFALDGLGMAEDDRRSVTQTGGLPYHGGPGSNYMTHSLAAMAETLRSDPGSYGAVSGVGMHMQKHAFGVWSTEPGSYAEPPAYAAATEPLGIVESPDGAATVATYSVLHGRDGGPDRALLVCDVAEGGRCYGVLDGGVPALLEAEADELIGRPVTLTSADGVNHAAL